MLVEDTLKPGLNQGNTSLFSDFNKLSKISILFTFCSKVGWVKSKEYKVI